MNIALFGAVGILMHESLQETPLSSVLRNLHDLGMSDTLAVKVRDTGCPQMLSKNYSVLSPSQVLSFFEDVINSFNQISISRW